MPVSPGRQQMPLCLRNAFCLPPNVSYSVLTICFANPEMAWLVT